ncbi:MAG: hypothetical protein QM760_01685 [Nibricoccus sp.]
MRPDGKSAADYRTAADAYGAALAEVPAGVPAGDLMFQRVLSAINSGQLDVAETIVDEYARDPRLDADVRWQMEWNLARALQAADAVPKAYARVNLLLDKPTSGGLPSDVSLRVSIAWLQARLAFENNDPARTLVLAEKLSGLSRRSRSGIEGGDRQQRAVAAGAGGLCHERFRPEYCSAGEAEETSVQTIRPPTRRFIPTLLKLTRPMRPARWWMRNARFATSLIDLRKAPTRLTRSIARHFMRSVVVPILWLMRKPTGRSRSWCGNIPIANSSFTRA